MIEGGRESGVNSRTTDGRESARGTDVAANSALDPVILVVCADGHASYSMAERALHIGSCPLCLQKRRPR